MFLNKMSWLNNSWVGRKKTKDKWLGVREDSIEAMYLKSNSNSSKLCK